MPGAYSRWLWSSFVRGEGPAVQCALTDIQGWISFSDYWCFRSGISRAQRRLIEYCLRRSGSQRPTAIDVGAHLGLFTAELAGRGFAQVHSFEPAARTFAKLERNIGKSPTTRGVVKLNCVAVGPRDGHVEFLMRPDSPATSHVQLDAAEGGENGLQRVPMTTLDSYCDTNKISQVDFLKIDTEGLEPFVLDGARQCLRNCRVPLMLLELCPPLLRNSGTSVEELYDRLQSNGYQPHELTNRGEPGEPLTIKQLNLIEWDDIVAIPRA